FWYQLFPYGYIYRRRGTVQYGRKPSAFPTSFLVFRPPRSIYCYPTCLWYSIGNYFYQFAQTYIRLYRNGDIYVCDSCAVGGSLGTPYVCVWYGSIFGHIVYARLIYYSSSFIGQGF